MKGAVAAMLARPGLKLGHYVGEFATPGIGYILKEAGAEFVFFDMEHSGNSFETVNRALRYFEAAGVAAFVRVPSDAYDHVARALDLGADAIVIPMLGTADQAKAVVEKIKYTPLGSRGLGLGLGNDRYHMAPFRDAIDAANARTRFVALIETAEGVANVDEIAALDGVDVLWVGHADLTASMGIPGEFGHPDYKKALEKVLAAGQRHNKGLGRMVTDAAAGVALAKEGWDLIAYHGDVWLLQTALRQGLDGIRAGVGGPPAKSEGKEKRKAKAKAGKVKR